MIISILALFFGLMGDNSWPSQMLQRMTLDEKIGQLFMVAGYVDRKFAEKEIGNGEIIEQLNQQITQWHPGGIAFVGPSESGKQRELTEHYQKISKYPLLIAQDLEWGLSMRLKDGIRFPKNITLGAIDNNELIYDMGREIASQARAIGVHMNLSPVVDLHLQPENVAINIRSFGSTPQQVAEKGVAMIRGLQDGGMIASAKHFPGLGDIILDPHLTLPSRQQLQEMELFPFARAIEAGVLSIQTEHLMVVEQDPKFPASLSSKLVTDVLKREMGFSGLILSGALRMKALTDYYSEEEIILKAFQAGNDMLLMPRDFPKAHQIVKEALASRKITEKEIDERVLKILALKKWVAEAIPLNATQRGVALKKELYRSVVSLVRDKQGLLPVKQPVAYIQLGEASSTQFHDRLPVKCLETLDTIDSPLIILAVFPHDPRRIEKIRLLGENEQQKELKQFHTHGFTEDFLQAIETLKKRESQVIAIHFGNRFGIHFFDGFSTFIMAYEDDPDAQEAAADIVLGKKSTHP